jgi:hypothetical protein
MTPRQLIPLETSADSKKPYSDFPEVVSIPGDATSKGQHFLAEAERLWRAEEGQISLTNIQAVCLMSYAYVSFKYALMMPLSSR